MKSGLTKRDPLTRQEVYDYLTEDVNAEVKHWGEDSYWANCAKRNRDETMRKFDAGEIVPVHTESYVDSYGNGLGDYTDTLYSDGSVKTGCYGYLD